MDLTQRLRQHIWDNRWQYVLLTGIFIAGMLVGNYKVPGLEGGVKSQLLQMIDAYLKGGMSGELEGSSIFFSAFWQQSKSILLIWFLGLTVIGLPLIAAVVFIRGIALGFTLGFLFQEKAGSGVVLSLFSVLPQNLVYLPILLMGAVMSVNFSLYVIKRKMYTDLPLGAGLIGYTLLMTMFGLLLLVGAFMEAWLSPWFLQVLVR